MSTKFVGAPCDDCVAGECTMNCSSAVIATGSEWIAASIWSGVFPSKATANQLQDWRSHQHGAGNGEKHGG